MSKLTKKSAPAAPTKVEEIEFAVAPVKKVVRRNAVSIKPIIDDSSETLLAPKSVRETGEEKVTHDSSVKITLTKKGDRAKAMEKIKAESRKAAPAEDYEHYRVGVMLSPMESGKSKKTMHEVIHEDFNRQHAELTVPMSVDDASFEKESKYDKDFLHHADDLVHMVLELPHGFHPKPSEQDEPPESLLQANLLGLPGGLSLSPAVTNKYFGEHSRSDFFDRYHFLSGQQSLLMRNQSMFSPSNGTVDNVSDFGSDDDDDDDGDDGNGELNHSLYSLRSKSSQSRRRVPISPGEILVCDHFDTVDEYVPFAPRRPVEEVDEFAVDLPDTDFSLSKIRANSRKTLLNMQPTRIPTIEEILGAESVVIEKINQHKAAVAARIAAEAEAKAFAEEKALRLSAAGRQEAAKLQLKAGKVIVPALSETHLKNVEAARTPSKPPEPRITLLKQSLTSSTVDVIAMFQDEKAVAALQTAATTRLHIMHSDENVTEDPEKFEKMTADELRIEKETRERKRLDAMKARLQATLQTWKEKSTKDMGNIMDNKKHSMLSEKERSEMVSLKSKPVDIKPVVYIPGTKGKLLSISKRLSDNEEEDEDEEENKTDTKKLDRKSSLPNILMHTKKSQDTKPTPIVHFNPVVITSPINHNQQSTKAASSSSKLTPNNRVKLGFTNDM